ncbi:unnamed protein product [Staurois parvus]|uniref:Uncharacterized protein n=1 Tax=Staurois parvus TaxID=386267 RepID=A0ABN9E5W6_9NEOB|nr:unnamed protein product [Staurois parvus]
MMPIAAGNDTRSPAPLPPLPSMAFLGSPVPTGEPENAAGVSAS